MFQYLSHTISKKAQYSLRMLQSLPTVRAEVDVAERSRILDGNVSGSGLHAKLPIFLAASRLSLLTCQTSENLFHLSNESLCCINSTTSLQYALNLTIL